MIINPSDLNKYYKPQQETYAFYFNLTPNGIDSLPPEKCVLHDDCNPAASYDGQIRYCTTLTSSKTQFTNYAMFADNLEEAQNRYQQLVDAAYTHHILQALCVTEYDIHADKTDSITMPMPGSYKKLRQSEFLDLLQNGVKPGTREFYLCTQNAVATKQVFKDPLRITSIGAILTIKKGEDVQVLTVAHEDLERMVFGDTQNRIVVFQKI